MTNAVIEGVEVQEMPVFVCQADLINSREFAARQASLLLANGFHIRRTELLIANPNTGSVVCRKTLNTWDTKLQAHRNIPDYRRDPRTGKSLWDKRKPWNLHQVWCLQKVAKYMQTPSIYRSTESKKQNAKAKKQKHAEPQEVKYILRLPTYEELNDYLAANSKLFTHSQFLEEYFGWIPTTQV